MTGALLESLAGGVLTLSFNRPERRNAWGAELEAALSQALAAADSDPAVRDIVLTGEGSTFCPGPSMSDAAAPASQGAEPAPLRDDPTRRYGYIRHIRKPVIAAINGAVAGVGLCITLFCDVRFMIEDARMTTAFSRRGLPAEHGCAWLLTRQIGMMNAADLLLSGRAITGREAERLGLVRALPRENFLPQVQAYAAEMARFCSPRAMEAIKRQLRLAQEQTLDEALRLASDEGAEAVGSGDYDEGISHFIARRDPIFPSLK